MADDLGYGDLSCYGSTTISTPHIDALAENGMRFTDFHSNGAVCSPTRAALLTGRYQQRCGIEGVVTAANHRDEGLDLSEETFAEALKPHGYRTALFGKWHLGYQSAFNPVKQGFDEFRGFVSGNIDYHSHIDQVGYEDWWVRDELKQEMGYTTHLITKHGLDYIERNKNKPFCLYLAHEAPHYPFQGPDDKADRTPGNPHPIGGSRKGRETAYREMITEMDKGIGRIMDKLQDLKIDQNTFVFFCSDNGPGSVGSAGPLRGRKGSLWEGGHRVPAVAHWPGRIKPGALSDQTTMTMDLFPTMVSLASGSVSQKYDFDGADLSPALFKNEKLPPRTLFWKHRQSKAVRKGPWKMVDDQLFDLENDPGETENLAEQYPEMVSELQKEFESWYKEVTDNVRRRA